jgi:hypothetical protein
MTDGRRSSGHQSQTRHNTLYPRVACTISHEYDALRAGSKLPTFIVPRTLRRHYILHHLTKILHHLDDTLDHGTVTTRQWRRIRHRHDESLPRRQRRRPLPLLVQMFQNMCVLWIKICYMERKQSITTTWHPYKGDQRKILFVLYCYR